MRVLQISKFYPPVMGGIEAVAWELAEGLNRAGVRTDVLCADQRPWGRHESASSGYDIWRAGTLGTLLSTSMAWAMPWRLARLAARADLIHLHMPDPMAAAALRVVNPPLPVVVHWHSDVIRQRRALKLYEPLQTWVLRRAAAIVATSPPYAESSAPLRPWRSKLEVIPIGISDHHGVACSQRAAEIRRQFRGRHIVFALGRMTYYKGFDVLIDAAALLPPGSVVVIGGDGELLQAYREKVARQGLAGRVHLIGHIPDDELPSHFEACDVFCMPSTERAEAYGVAMLEAMVTGKPAVASDIPGSGVPWVNQHGVTGLNVPARDARALGSALARLLGDDAMRQRMGHAARERYLVNFSAETMTRRMIDLYARALGTGNESKAAHRQWCKLER